MHLVASRVSMVHLGASRFNRCTSVQSLEQGMRHYAGDRLAVLASNVPFDAARDGAELLLLIVIVRLGLLLRCLLRGVLVASSVSMVHLGASRFNRCTSFRAQLAAAQGRHAVPLRKKPDAHRHSSQLVSEV